MGGKIWSPREEHVFWTIIVPMAAQGRQAPTRATFRALVPQMTAMGDPTRRTYNDSGLHEHWHRMAVQMSFSPHGRTYALRWIANEPARCLALGVTPKYNIVNNTLTTEKGEVIQLPVSTAPNAVGNASQGPNPQALTNVPVQGTQAPAASQGSINQAPNDPAHGLRPLSIQSLLSQPEAAAEENSGTLVVSARDLFDEADKRQKAIASKQEATLHSIETGSAKKAKSNMPKWVVYLGPDQQSQPGPEDGGKKGGKRFMAFKNESVNSLAQRYGEASEEVSELPAESTPLPLAPQPQQQPQRPDPVQVRARWEEEMRENAAEMRRLEERNSQLARLSWGNTAYQQPPQQQAVWRPAPSGYYDHSAYYVHRGHPGGYESPGPYQDPGYYFRGPAYGPYYGRGGEEEHRDYQREQ